MWEGAREPHRIKHTLSLTQCMCVPMYFPQPLSPHTGTICGWGDQAIAVVTWTTSERERTQTYNTLFRNTKPDAHK